LHVLVFGHILLEIADHLVTAGKAPFNLSPFGQGCILAGKIKDRVHVTKQFLGLLGSDFGLARLRRLVVRLIFILGGRLVLALIASAGHRALIPR
jgi:hypothetical protein